MCLNHLNFTKKGLSRKVLTGYKVFIKVEPDNQNTLDFQYNLYRGSSKVIFNKWLVAIEICQFLYNINNEHYQTGFHIYKKPTDALQCTYRDRETVVKVKYKGVLAEGSEHGCPVVVAKHLWVPQQKKGRRNKGCLRKSRQLI